MAGPGCSKRCATATWAAGTAAAATCPRATARSIAAPADRPPIRSTHGRPAMTQWYYSDYERNRHGPVGAADLRSEEHTSEIQSLMRISYAVFCLNKKKQ